MKRDAFREAESLRSKDGQRLQSVKECVKRLWNTLKTMFLSVKLQSRTRKMSKSLVALRAGTL